MSLSLNSFYQRMLLGVLKRFQLGRLEMTLPDGSTQTFGSGDNGPSASMNVTDENFFRSCALYGNVGLGEGYIN